jgi:hypothetical protein
VNNFQLESLEHRQLLSAIIDHAIEPAARRPADRAGSTFAKARNVGTLFDDSKRFSDYVGVGDTADYYRFKLISRSITELTLTGTSTKVQLTLIRDRNENGRLDASDILGHGFGRKTSKQISPILHPATYFARVYQRNGRNNYNLRFTTRPSDSGETLQTAANLGNLTRSITFIEDVGDSDPMDVYRLNLAPGTDLLLTLSNLSDDADLELIQDLNGNGDVDDDEVIDSSFSPDRDDERIELLGGSGLYFVRVIPVDDPNLPDQLLFAEYTLRFEV